MYACICVSVCTVYGNSPNALNIKHFLNLLLSVPVFISFDKIVPNTYHQITMLHECSHIGDPLLPPPFLSHNGFFLVDESNIRLKFGRFFVFLREIEMIQDHNHSTRGQTIQVRRINACMFIQDEDVRNATSLLSVGLSATSLLSPTPTRLSTILNLYNEGIKS